MKLGASTRAISPDAPRLRPILPVETQRRLAELEAALLEAECQRDRAFAEWHASGDSTFLYRVYTANVDGVTRLRDEINRVSGGAQS